MKVEKLPALHTVCFYSPGDIPDTHFPHDLPHDNSAAGKIKSMEVLKDPHLESNPGPSEVVLRPENYFRLF